MQLSLLVARILGITYICAGIAAFRGKIDFQKVIQDFEKSQGLTFVSGFITLILGMLLVTYHNIWVNNWIVLITIVGWLSLIKGVMLIVYPQFMSYFRGWYKNTKLWGGFMMVFGLVFWFLGWWG